MSFLMQVCHVSNRVLVTLQTLLLVQDSLLAALQTLEAEQTAAMDASRQLPDFGPGDVVEIRMV